MAARAIQSAVITFGLVSIPIKLYTAASADDHKVKFSMITPKGNRVKQKWVDAVTGDEIQQTECSKGYEHAKDQFIVFTKDEISSLEAEKSAAMEITEFVPADSVDPVNIEKSYYIGVDKGGDKGYVLLSKVMRQTGKVAVARWNSRGREHLIVIRPLKDGLVLQQMFYQEEVRDFSEITDKVATVKFHEVEEQMAAQLVESLSSEGYDPGKYHDGFVERVKKAVEEKQAGGTVTVATTEKQSNVVDLMAALKASLEKTAKKA